MDAFILLRFGIWTGDDIDVKNDFLYQRPLIPSNWYICSHRHASNISTHRIIQFFLTLTPISTTPHTPTTHHPHQVAPIRQPHPPVNRYHRYPASSSLAAANYATARNPEYPTWNPRR